MPKTTTLAKLESDYSKPKENDKVEAKKKSENNGSVKKTAKSLSSSTNDKTTFTVDLNCTFSDMKNIGKIQNLPDPRIKKEIKESIPGFITMFTVSEKEITAKFLSDYVFNLFRNSKIKEMKEKLKSLSFSSDEERNQYKENEVKLIFDTLNSILQGLTEREINDSDFEKDSFVPVIQRASEMYAEKVMEYIEEN
ncbi:MAG: hypothetical protein FWD34_00785 [Oscillospiraceae bacterium]|nr:hypothetical protein [Oscillospiraceae bacterium]